MRYWRAPVGVASAAAISGLWACGPAPGQGRKVQATQEAIQEERGSDKLLARGRMFARVGDLTRASQYFEAALQEGASDEEVMPLLMRTYVDSGRFRVAITRGEAFLGKRPRAVQLRFLVGTLHVAVGEPAKALEHFRHAINVAPGHAPSHHALAVQLRDSEGDWMRADYHFRKYLELAPDGPHAEEARASLLKSVR